MFASGESLWGPPPLPEFLLEQLDSSGFGRDDAPRCVERLSRGPDPAVAAELFVDLGSCKLLEGDLDGAMAAWRHAIASPHNEAGARALLNLGLLYAQLNLHERAIGVLQSVAERDVEKYVAPAVMATARCQHALGNSEQAMESMARLAYAVMAEQPDSGELAQTFFGLGELAANATRLDRAERAWRVASAAAPSPAQQAASDSLVQLFIAQGHDDELLDLLDAQPSTASPTNADVLLDHAEALNRRGKENQARVLARSITGADLGTNDRFRLGDFRLQVGLVNEAIDEFEVLLVDPVVEVHQRAAFSLGDVYRNHDMADVAASMYQRAVDGHDRYWSPKAALALGDLRHEAGESDAAAMLWTQAASAPIAALRADANRRLANPEPPADADGDSEQAEPTAPPTNAQPTLVSPTPEATPRHDPVLAAEVLSIDAETGAARNQLGADDAPTAGPAVDDLAANDLTAIEGASPSDVGAPVEDASPSDADASVEGESASDVGAEDRPARAATAEPDVIDLAANDVTADDVPTPSPVEKKSVHIVSLDELEAAEAAENAAAADRAAGTEPDSALVEIAEVGQDPSPEPPVVADVEPVDATSAAPESDPVSTPGANRARRAVRRRTQQAGESTTSDELIVREPVGEPVYVALDALEDAESEVSGAVAEDHDDVVVAFDPPVDIEPVAPDPTPARAPKPTASTFVNQLDQRSDSTMVPNPYAALAPDGHEGDVAPSTRNPYAELAPEFADDDFQPDSDVEPGDWESMLDDWPKAKPERSERGPKKRSSAFSRYT